MGIDTNTWIKMIRRLPTSRSEQEVLRRFEEDPSGRQFLPLSDVLRNHKLVNEAMELLAQGLEDHPGFSVARVVLARELFLRGLIFDAWTVLDRAPFPLSDNVLAQKLKYKIAILLGDEAGASSAYQYLNIQQGIDPEIKTIAYHLELDGIAVTRETYRADLIKRGVDVQMPQMEMRTNDAGSAGTEKPKNSSGVRNKRFVLDFALDDAMRHQVDQFQVVSLSEVFSPDADVGGVPRSPASSPVELDSSTLADIYAKQGFYAKSLAIYQRILRMAPHNDMIRMKVAELGRLNSEQMTGDLEIDPVAYEHVEVLGIIDRQARFLNELLERLDQR